MNLNDPFPVMTRVRQRFPSEQLSDVKAVLRSRWQAEKFEIKKGARIAVAVGSRGIADLLPIVQETVRCIRDQGGAPFIVPAMGSHGGATAEGQAEVLAGYGITESGVGAPIQSSMDVVELPQGTCDVKVFMDRVAQEADGIVVVNRIKPHTDFHDRFESGIMKMIAIGLGNHDQALAVHAHGVRGLREILPKVAEQKLAHAPILCGIGIVENAYERTAELGVIPAARIPKEEPRLLALAAGLYPKLPVSDLELLIVDEMGKDISGVGMDTNVIGRIRIAGEAEPERPRIQAVVVRDLTPASHGNAIGMGLADVMTRRLFEKVNLQETNTNVVTSAFLERGKMPLVADTDREAIAFAARLFGHIPWTDARVIRLKNTLHLEEFQVSPAVLKKIEASELIEVLGEVPQSFDADGMMVPFHSKQLEESQIQSV